MGASDDYEKYSSIADELELDDDDKDSFVSSAMKRKGHRPVTSWADNEDDNGKGGGDFFSGKRKEKTREVRKNGSGNGGWQYQSGS